MTTKLLWEATCLLAVLLTAASRLCLADDEPGSATTEMGVTFRHVYKIEMPQGSCEHGQQKDAERATTGAMTGEDDMVFRHHIQLQTPACDCSESEALQSLLYRVNGLEEEVQYLKTQCAHRCSSSNSGVPAPGSLQLVNATDASLLVQWLPVQGAEYYMLSYHPQDDDQALQQHRLPNTEYSNLISGLTPGVTYDVEVYAGTDLLQSEPVSIQATTEVSGVAAMRVTGRTEASLTVDWENPTAVLVDHFRLTHTDPRGHQGQHDVQQSQAARTQYTVVGLQPGTEYLISVQAIMGTTEGKATLATGVTDLDAPTSLVTTEVTEDTALVSWDRVRAEVDGYVLTHTSSEGPGPEVSLGADSAAHRLTGLRPGVRYTVYVWAVHGSEAGGKSSTDAETDIDTPQELKAADVAMDTARLTWIPPLAVIEGYILTYRAADGTMETVQKMLGPGEGPSFYMSGLASGKRYVVTLIAHRGAQRSTVAETSFKTVGLLHPFPVDCVQVMGNGNAQSGVYTVYLNGEQPRATEVFCDMDTDGGGWLMLQRRTIGKLDFMKRWRQYVTGFGNLTEEFWLGMDNIFELTDGPTQYEVRFDLGAGSERAHATYDSFKIAPAKQKFKLHIGRYSGTAGDAMTYHQGRPWSTVDSDNDMALGNCALNHRGAWWYKNCHLANLNGRWGDTRHSMGVNWEPWKGHLTSLDFTEMKIRPLGAAAGREARSAPATQTERHENRRA